MALGLGHRSLLTNSTEAEVDLEVGEHWRGRPVLNDGSCLRSSRDLDRKGVDDM